MDELFHDATERNRGVKKDIKYETLRRHIERMHPTKIVNGERKPFGVCENLGTLMPLRRCIGTTKPMAR